MWCSTNLIVIDQSYQLLIITVQATVQKHVISHNFFAAPSSWAAFEGSFCLQSAKHNPLTPSTSCNTAK